MTWNGHESGHIMFSLPLANGGRMWGPYVISGESDKPGLRVS